MQEKGNIPFLVLFAMAFLIVSLPIYFIFTNKSARNTDNTVSITKEEPYAGTKLNSQSLLGYVANFENLSLSDLPMIGDVRNVGEYNGNKIVIGYNKVIEYDPKTNLVVRLGTGILNSQYSGTVLGNKLYTGVNGRMMGQQPNVTWGSSTIYITNLATGITEKSLLTDKIFSYKLGNLRLITLGKYIYGGSSDGVIRIDPEDYSYKLFTPNDLKIENPGTIYLRNNTVYFTDWNFSKEAKLDLETQTWSVDPKDIPSMGSIINTGPEVWNVPQLDSFEAISQMVGDQYYLFSTQAIYTLSRNEFPKLLTNLKFSSGQNNFNKLSDKAYVTSDKRMALLFRVVGSQGQDLLLHVFKVDLGTGSVVELKTNEKELSDPTSYNNLFSKIFYISSATFSEANGVVTAHDETTNSEVLKVFLKENVVEISH